MIKKKFKILCVDDEPDIVSTLRRAFRKDYEVVSATSGAEGIELIKSQPFDLIISDQRMPGVTGEEVLKFAKETQPEAIRILLTGYSDIESLVKCVNDAGIHKYIAKPWEPEMLRLTVLHALESQYLEEKLRKSQELLREAQEIAGLGSYAMDISTGMWESSQVFDKLFGINEAYARTRDGWAALVHPDDRTMMADYITNEVLGQGKVFDKEYRIIRHDDHAERWLRGLGKLEFDASGRPLKILGTVQDITERKRADEALRIAAVTFESHDAILITDKNANIVRVNHSFSEITGYSEDELIGKNPRVMSSGEHDRSFYVEMWQELIHNGHWSGEILDRAKNGQIYPKWLTITAIKDEQQEPTHYVAIFSNITVRKHAEGEIHNLAFYDTLTKLPNRRLFLDRLQAALSASVRHNDYGAVMFIDMDNFKELNDMLGHKYGDLLLLEVGERIKSCVREMDTVARFGGDEFVVLIESSGNDLNEAIHKNALVAEKIRVALAQPYKLNEHEYHSSSSIGICLYHGNDEPLEMLIEQADMAMYQVKKTGRNAVRFFDPAMQHNAAKHNALKNDLHSALAKQQLQLHFQIQVDKDGHPLGAEALLRWIHPKHGLIMPSQFISIAEEGTLILDIDRWVLITACQQLALWSKDDKSRNLTLTVNISAKWFAQPGFVNEVAEILKDQQVDPALLKLELSERIVQSDLNSSMDKIRALRKLGCRLSIDNFGTVYSSLSFLKSLSPDQLKIHQEFVHSISLNTQDAQLARTVIDFAKSLDLDIFAEGVETKEQQTFLISQDCNTFQGYLYGKPVPIDEFDALLGKL